MRSSLMENLDPETLQSIANGKGVGWTNNERRYAALLATSKCPHCGKSLRKAFSKGRLIPAKPNLSQSEREYELELRLGLAEMEND